MLMEKMFFFLTLKHFIFFFKSTFVWLVLVYCNTIILIIDFKIWIHWPLHSNIKAFIWLAIVLILKYYVCFKYKKLFMARVCGMSIINSSWLTLHLIFYLFNSAKGLQSFTKYFRLTLVFKWNSALWEKFNFCFSRVFC